MTIQHIIFGFFICFECTSYLYLSLIFGVFILTISFLFGKSFCIAVCISEPPTAKLLSVHRLPMHQTLLLHRWTDHNLILLQDLLLSVDSCVNPHHYQGTWSVPCSCFFMNKTLRYFAYFLKKHTKTRRYLFIPSYFPETFYSIIHPDLLAYQGERKQNPTVCRKQRNYSY